MKVRDIMTKDVVCLRSDDTIERAARLMKQYNVGSLQFVRMIKLSVLLLTVILLFVLWHLEVYPCKLAIS